MARTGGPASPAFLQDEARGRAVKPAAKSQRRLLYVVASPRPLVGKTFVARLVADFLRLDGAAVVAFDLDRDEGSLADALPGLTTKAHIGSTRGQVALFDRLIVDDGVAKVVDVDRAQFDRFFACMEEIGFVEEVRRRGIELVILFAADPHPASARAYVDLQRRFPDAVLVPVFNEAVLKGRKLREQFPSTSAAALPLPIALLPPLLKTQVERAACSFADFPRHLPPSIAPVHAAELRAWARRSFLELRELELRLLLERLRSSLRE